MTQTFTTAVALTAVAAAAALLAPAAHAQSEVSVYGRINLTLERQSANDVDTTKLVNNSSRIGFKASHTIDASTKVGMQLETGVQADDGEAKTPFWGRQAELNLTGNFGMVRAGRFTSEAYFATADYVSNHNHDTGTSSDALYAYVGRDANKVAYRAPTFVPGLQLEIGSALKEADTTAKDTLDVAVNYTAGDLQLGLGYEKNGDATQVAVRAFYTAGAFGFGGYVQQDKDAFAAKAAGSRTNVRLTGMYSVGQTEYHLNLGSAGEIGHTADTGAKQATVGINYKLDKATKVYGYYTKVDDSAVGVYGGDFSALALGVRYNF